MSIGSNILKYRELAKMTQKELAEKLGVSPTCLNYYEKDKRSPDVETVKKIANELNVSGNQLLGLPDPIIRISEPEQDILEKYRQLDIYGKKLITVVADAELERMQKESEKFSNDEPDTLKIPYFDDMAAAGTGYMFNNNGAETITVTRSRVTERTDFIVTVSGSSMEPEYQDGDKVLVHAQPDIYEGEIGIFAVNDSGFIKQKGENRLISLNKQYSDIFITENDHCVCFGKVLGKLDENSIL